MLEAFFSVDHMLKPAQRIGSIPDSKTVYQNFFKIAWPSAVESTLVGLVGAIDTMMVGGIGTAAIAAVGITNQPKFILLAAINSLNVGVTAIVARRKGENNQESANSCLRQCLLLSAFISIFMAVMGFLLLLKSLYLQAQKPIILTMLYLISEFSWLVSFSNLLT